MVHVKTQKSWLYLPLIVVYARHAITKVKQSFQRLVIGWVIKNVLFDLFRDLEGTLRLLVSTAFAVVSRYLSIRTGPTWFLIFIHKEGRILQ
jgi:hypothetical protein